MKTKFGTLILLGGLSMTAFAQDPTVVVQDIYSQTGTFMSGEGLTVAANAFSWHTGGLTSELSVFPGIIAGLTDPSSMPSSVESINQDIDGVLLSWNAAEKLLNISCPTGKLGRLEVRVYNMNGVQLASNTPAESTTSISLNNFVPDNYLVALTEDGKLIKTIKLHLK